MGSNCYNISNCCGIKLFHGQSPHMYMHNKISEMQEQLLVLKHNVILIVYSNFG